MAPGTTMLSHLEFDAEQHRILPALFAMFEEMSHFHRLFGDDGHGVAFFGC